MQVAIPHDLGRDEVRRRLRARSHTLADHIPGGVADLTTRWPSEDHMTMAIGAMGQTLTGDLVIEDSQLVLTMALPPALGFLEPVIEGAIRQQGQQLLEGPAPE